MNKLLIGLFLGLLISLTIKTVYAESMHIVDSIQVGIQTVYKVVDGNVICYVQGNNWSNTGGGISCVKK